MKHTERIGRALRLMEQLHFPTDSIDYRFLLECSCFLTGDYAEKLDRLKTSFMAPVQKNMRNFFRQPRIFWTFPRILIFLHPMPNALFRPGGFSESIAHTCRVIRHFAALMRTGCSPAIPAASAMA